MSLICFTYFHPNYKNEWSRIYYWGFYLKLVALAKLKPDKIKSETESYGNFVLLWLLQRGLGFIKDFTPIYVLITVEDTTSGHWRGLMQLFFSTSCSICSSLMKHTSFSFNISLPMEIIVYLNQRNKTLVLVFFVILSFITFIMPSSNNLFLLDPLLLSEVVTYMTSNLVS